MKPILRLHRHDLPLIAFSLFISANLCAEKPSAAPAGSIAAALQPYVDDHTLAGAVVLTANKGGTISTDTVGYEDIAAKKPMRANDLFWIASMTKAMTAAALMILVDEGKVKIDDAVEKYLPEFKTQMVAAERDEKHMLLVPLKHPITVKHLLSHTSGLPFKSALESGALDQGTLRERVISYAFTPLLSQPGAQYLYSNAGINTAARIIEVVTGMSYEDFMDKRLLAPLGMKDTTYWPSGEQLTRIAKSYKPNAEKNNLEETTVSQLTYPLDDRKRQPMPAGGYYSTAEDVSKFCRLLISGGTLNGNRVLSEDAVKTMTSVQSGGAPDAKGNASSYGFGLQVSGPAIFGHGGAYSTQMWMDAQRQIVVILMVQHAGYPNDGGKKINSTVLKVTMGVIGK